MDTSTVLEKYTQDLVNLPSEVKFLLDEIRNKDAQLQEVRRRWQARDAHLHKFIKTNSTLAKHPKEAQINAKIEEEQKQVTQIQQEKVLLANTALYIVSKHLFQFEADIAKLEADDLLPPESAVITDDYRDNYGMSDSAISGSATPRNAPQVPAVASEVRRSLKRKMGVRVGGSRLKRRLQMEDDDDDEPRMNAGSFALTNDEYGEHHGHSGPGGDDADNNLYCFCQRVSFGEMIGCDNDDCKYEWFHWSCVGITSPPKDDEVWYCPDCAPKMEKRKKKRKVA